jgi:hypothetical protein
MHPGVSEKEGLADERAASLFFETGVPKTK